MLRMLGILGGVSVVASLLAWPAVANARAQEPTEPGVVPDAGEPAEPEPEPDPEPEPEPTFSATASTSAPAPTPSAAAIEDEDDDGIRPFKGRFGLGVIRTIAGLNGINLRYFITDRFALGANVGVALFAFKENDPASTDVCPGPDCDFENTRTLAAIAASIEALYFAKLGRTAGRLPFRADFGLGGRFGFMQIVNGQDIGDNLDDPTELHVELPFIIQLMFGENFALAPEFGVDFRIVPGSREDPGDANPGTGFPGEVAPGDAPPGGPPVNPPRNGPGIGFEITNGIGLFGGASMHYYF
jgi:hypothetical protein